MNEIEHRHRLEGIDGEIDPRGSDWRAGGEHLILWRAAGVEDLAAAASRLRSVTEGATLDYLARRGAAEEDAEEVVESDKVDILEVRFDGDGLEAVLRVRDKRG